MLVGLEVFYLGHLKNFYTIQYNTIQYNRSLVVNAWSWGITMRDGCDRQE